MISHEGFLYRRDKKLDTINWRCAKAGCKGCLTTILPCHQQQQPPVSSGVQQMHLPNDDISWLISGNRHIVDNLEEAIPLKLKERYLECNKEKN